jgi:hypothetical protein
MLVTAHSKLTCRSDVGRPAFRRDGGVYPAIPAVQPFGTGAQR